MAEDAASGRVTTGRARFELSGGALCLDFANSWGDRRRPESDRLDGYPALLDFARAAGLLDRAAAARLARRARGEPAAAARAFDEARRLREALYRVFSAQAHGRRVAAADLDAVNHALHEALPHLRVTRRGGGYAWDWRRGGGEPLDAPLRPIARSAAELLTSADVARVRECDGATCTWLFLDSSRNRSRRWCSMESCGNRAKARRHYHRQRRIDGNTQPRSVVSVPKPARRKSPARGPLARPTDTNRREPLKVKSRLAVLALALLAGAALRAEEKPYTTNERGLDRRNMDLTADPCADFYQYANGGWLAKNPIPADQSGWGVGSEVRERNYLLLREILDEAAAAKAAAGSNRQKVGDFWHTAMDTTAIEKQGAQPLAADLAEIAKLETPEQIAAFTRKQQAMGDSNLFGLGVLPDLKDSTRYMVYAVQGGLGLPDRDYYTRTDEESKQLREKYVAHVAAMLHLLGDQPAAAQAAAKEILALETRLANASLTNVELRNPANYYNPKSPAEADQLTPRFPWTAQFKELGLADLSTFSYAHPKFFAEMNAALGEVPAATWRNYLRWQLVTAYSQYLSDAFVNENFAFYGKTLQGTQELRPRWKRAVDQTSGSLGEALGQVYVERAFPPATKKRADEMIENLRGAVRTRLTALDWMGEETKKQALAKLESFVSKIGHPEKWRDYSALTITRDSYAANVRAANVFELRRNLAKIGKPIDRSEWGMSPQTVNAYYNPLMNEIVFPAAIMLPPFFDGEMDDAVNYGGMGGIIGHEFMHGFDDQGSQFDAQGNMKSWWTAEDRKRFEERTHKMVEQYDRFVAVEDLHVNGKLTLGENIGDMAGVTMAYHALQQALAGKERQKIDGFTPEQRFFLAWAQAWRRNYRPESLKLQVNTDPHSPSKFRVMGPLANMPEFAAAFSCKEGDPMVAPAATRVTIW
jgi:putative endopeptidase